MPPRAFSRHLFTEGVHDANGNLVLTSRKPYRFKELSDNRVHRVQEGDTLFNLAGRYFSSFERPAGFYWVIADFQPVPIIDPTLRLIPGTDVVIPSERALREEIFNEARREETRA